MAAHRANLGFENAGVERWVRELRDAAPPGVDFVYSTTTIKSGMNLPQRVYKISAIADDEMYQFTLRMKPSGPADDALERLGDETRVSSAAERFTAPPSASKTATAGTLDAITQAATTFNQRAARWPNKVTAAEIRALSQRLDDLIP